MQKKNNSTTKFRERWNDIEREGKRKKGNRWQKRCEKGGKGKNINSKVSKPKFIAIIFRLWWIQSRYIHTHIWTLLTLKLNKFNRKYFSSFYSLDIFFSLSLSHCVSPLVFRILAYFLSVGINDYFHYSASLRNAAVHSCIAFETQKAMNLHVTAGALIGTALTATKWYTKQKRKKVREKKKTSPV